jgi:hypothetical protein
LIFRAAAAIAVEAAGLAALLYHGIRCEELCGWSFVFETLPEVDPERIGLWGHKLRWGMHHMAVHGG